MTSRIPDLLNDIAKLLRKYGPEEFRFLAKLVKSKDFVTTLIDILEQAERASSDYRIQPAQKNLIKDDLRSTNDLRSTLDSLQANDHEKFMLISEAHMRLAAQDTLPQLKDIRDFAGRIRMPRIKARSRREAIEELLLFMTKQSLGNLKSILELLPVSDRMSSEETGLRGWSEIILDKDPNKR